ncbi:hypothetical protein ACJMK2_030383 [Sinanodonta woodiana]|uniref:Sialate O-acetylesterase domain-containing protein n=1 Tax=Sinanodonta woodiana TaxID=1069815 RepID=A0ABD3XFF5_SINWO
MSDKFRNLNALFLIALINNTTMKWTILVVCLHLCRTNVDCASGISFARSYGNHMVLQGAPNRAVLWGFAHKIGDIVHVSLNNHEVTTTTVVAHSHGGSSGIWKVKLPAQNSKGPFVIHVSSSEGSATISDVLFGDVWFCSGQSNMGFKMNHVFNYTEELNEAAKYSEIRIFSTNRHTSNTSLTDLSSVNHWYLPNSTSVGNFSAVCWLYGKYLYPHIHRPIGLIESAWGGTIIEAWSSHDALAKCTTTGHRVNRAAQNHPSVLFNAMVSPFLPMTIYGVIWYQGESNSPHADRYVCQFPAMIADWRHKFHQASMGETNETFPFGFVQLAGNGNDTNRGFPDLRWAQTANYGHVPNAQLPNVFMSVAMDLPDFHSPYGSVHPRDKQDVASRLVLAARAVAYGENGLDFQGPIPTKFTLHGSSLTIEFNQGNSPIEVRSDSGFEMCCTHSTDPNYQCPTTSGWSVAHMTSHSSSSITLDVTSCTAHGMHIRGVRYAWHEGPCQVKHCAIYGRDNDLPAPPFKHHV